MKDSSHLTLHLTLLPTPCGIKLLHPEAAFVTLFAKVCHFSHSFSSPLRFPLLSLSLSLIRPFPKGLVLLITSLQQRNRRKKGGQWETSVRFISVRSDPDTARDWHRLACVSPCVCVLIDEEQLFMECQTALHIPTLKFSHVCVCLVLG